MSRYIDADALREKVLYHADTMNHAGNHEHAKAFNYCLCMIDDMPTADVVEVEHGKWIEDDSGAMYCTACCLYPLFASKTDYCPNCGAKMDGREEEE